MTDAVERSVARCADCGKAYRVPDPHKSYACKACGGVVHAAVEGDPLELEGTVTCTACHAINREEARACVECGEPLLSEERPASSVRAAQREASYALKRGYAWIGAITWLYRLGAAGYGFGTVAAIGALSTTAVPLGDGILVVALFTLMTMTMLTGAIQILFKPFVWTLAVAILATITAAVHYFGPNPLDVAIFWSAGWAALFWASVVPTFRFKRLIDRHTDLYITHHASRSTRRSVEGRSPRERHARLVRAMRRAYRHAARVSLVAAAIVLVASVAGTYLVRTNLRPDDALAAIDRFEAAWSTGDLEAVGALLPEEVRAREVERLAGLTESYGWDAKVPALGPRELDQKNGRIAVTYPVGGVTLRTSWMRQGQSWLLTRLELPVPPFAPVLDGFLAAWRASDPAALASFYSEANREARRADIANAARKRSWSTFPKVLEVERSGEDEEELIGVTLQLEKGEVTTRWAFRPDGRWGLTAFKLPAP